MNNRIISEELLEAVIPVISKAWIDELETRTDYGYRFSERFERAMSELMKTEKKQAYKRQGIRMLKRALAGAAALTVGVLTVFMSGSANRSRFFEAIRQWKDNGSVEIHYHADEGEVELEPIYPGFIPEEYHLVYQQEESPITLVLIYEDNNGNGISWTQNLINNTTVIGMNSEYLSKTEYPVGDSTLTLYHLENGDTIAYLEYERYVFMVTAHNLAEEEVLAMFRDF